MKIYLALFLSIIFCATNSYAQATDADADTTMLNGKVPSNKSSINFTPVIKPKYSNQKPVTVRQVEKQTGGKVIGAKTINIHGKQLNQIKVLMPNGRIIIHEQLFDSNGRSVETVEEVEPTLEIQTK